MKRIPYLDSHTGGEPTRLITSLPFDLGTGSVADKLSTLKKDHDDFRTTVLNEPRGSDVLVGAYLVPPADPTCQFGVIYFNNVGYLGMCGHGTIGLIASLAYLGKVQPGVIRVETPVGVVEATLHRGSSSREAAYRDPALYPNKVSVKNIPAYRHLTHVPVTVDGKTIHGDVAWGGNWFFLCHDHGLEVNMQNLEALTEFSWRVREQLTANGITGANGAEIDHVELFTSTPDADSKSFVLCPGKAYDRSPCGTGTSAKLACLYGDGKLQVGQTWKQQSVVGSIFEGSIQLDGDKIIPTITGEAWVMSEGTILVDERDPFGKGI
ncbi:MAG: proline racemase family protein [Anaerolineales bacterium]|uniref:proline racemase family protein n=1 Tax=Candidatus Villigracilis proximus TaxID=3140683 RepID=UPI00313542B2|nr:proline racemase family protein [Anaerolineales bacterium]